MRSAFYLLMHAVAFISAAITATYALYLNTVTPNRPGFTAADLSDLSFVTSILLSEIVFLILLLRRAEAWRRESADVSAIFFGYSVLWISWDLANGKGKVLDVDEALSLVRANLGDFAAHSDYFADPERRDSVLRHVAAVQRELMKCSDRLLSDGVLALPDLVKTVGPFLERLVDQRWLGLLDLPDAADAESIVRSAGDRDSRRNALIIISGAAIAALVVGLATTVGISAETAVLPAALVSLVGPVIWGGKSLGVSPRVILGSIMGSTSGDGQVDSRQPTGGNPGGDVS
ncbi:hypothetical protein [Streptomyces doebereineriae]|uniref:DUF4239 domain-containing protein n=1 Tax=Streptomyces doebereineriae TaxID=3075528 RepID=A0ABU2V543_9ACTN|nr:hypothetical protein [Streptomyces sp. DSM 41640]MDT0480339.1 hypothetical protein [Streptomyces sp. DSM 41640]